ncbi:M56 family metallopeptidase [Myroides sp. DF42-4-2]|uniref:M56 family metallopeptidase n=1 Tax=unclassified Myroides TaxID=2642485 RepID=UPI002577462A|nr:M56 family metallopeptidase [Myroides sp. DF42-4-2]MDM1406308.1 energy transducer TonB [Myroides sp. DF42-4-2]
MLLYLIQTTVLLFMTLGIYKLFLEQTKIHEFKRYYLLAALVLALILPLVKIPSTSPLTIANSKLQELNEIIISPTTSSTADAVYSYITPSTVLLLLYSLGVLIMLIRFFKSIQQYKKLEQRGSLVYDRGQRFVLVDHIDTAFTFRDTIYLPLYIPIDWTNKIILHEYNHVKQHHSRDILFIEILKIVFWFQPLLYWYQQHIALNHEFLADDTLNTSKEETQAYLQLLLTQTYQNNEQPMSSSFNFNLTKKRFIMLTKVNKPLHNTLAVLGTFAFICILGATTVFAQERKKENTETTRVGKENQSSNSDEVYIAVTKPATYPGGMEEFNKDFIANFKLPETELTTARVILMFVVEKDGSLNEVKIVKDPGYGIGEAAIEALSKTKKWIPAQYHEKVVRSQFTLPITLAYPPTEKENS